MMHKPKTILITLVVGLILLTFSCDDQSRAKKESTPNVVSGKISQPVIQTSPPADTKKEEPAPENNPIPEVESEVKKDDLVTEQKVDMEKNEHYDAQGKIDPFRPLIQEKSEETKPIVDPGPKRILTPLEKVELSQIRLVAIILMDKKQIAMVEEANGKGYEVGIGTYIGKNQGRVIEIKNSSIIIKELVKDYKGRLIEQVQEIKLHKIDNEE